MKRPTVLITGASSGLGAALARLFAKKNYNLILLARRLDLLQTLAAQIKKECPDCQIETQALDVAQYESLFAVIGECAKKFGTLDVVIANAGVGYTTSEWQNTWQKSRQTIEINLLGAIATLEAAKDIMLQQGFGQLVAISSSAATRGLPQSSAYCASKAGLSHFMESLRLDLMDHNIVVTNVQPGFVRTPMTQKNGWMPWVLDVDDAAHLIYRAICKKKARLDFPWQMAFMLRVLRLIPHGLYDFLMGQARGHARRFKQNRD